MSLVTARSPLPVASTPSHEPISSAPGTTNLLDWLPFLWLRVVFPGRAESVGPWRWSVFLGLIALAGIVVLPSLHFPLFEPDEGRYAQIPKEMLDRGDWLTPTLQGEPYLDKPPLFYWLIMLAYRTLGESDGNARIVPALAILAIIGSAYGFGRRSLGERPAFWGTLLLTLSPGLVSMGRILVLDGLLTLWVTLGLLTSFEAIRGPRWSRGWWLGASVAIGLGTLTKGPIAIILIVPPILAYRWLTRSAVRISGKAWLALAAIVTAINLPWYVAITVRHPEFASYFLWKHNLQRFLTPFDHEEPFWYFLPVMFLGLAPVAALIPFAGRFLLSNRPILARRRSSEMGFFLLAGLWCVGFFSLSGSKLPTYILPAFPPLCLAMGAYVVASGWSRSRWFRGGLAVWGVTLLLGHNVAVPAVAWHRSPMNHADEARSFIEDANVPIYCYPRPVDSVAFYTGRSDFQVYRSKDLAKMLESMDKHRRSVVLFAHRNSKLILTHNFPPHFRVVYVGKLGLCDMAVVER